MSGISTPSFPAILQDYTEKAAQGLAAVVDRLLDKHEFTVGQRVMWKEGCRNRLFPDDNQAAIITEIFAKPVNCEAPVNPCDPAAAEVIDMKIAVNAAHLPGIGETLVELFIDSRRIRPYSARGSH